MNTALSAENHLWWRVMLGILLNSLTKWCVVFLLAILAKEIGYGSVIYESFFKINILSFTCRLVNYSVRDALKNCLVSLALFVC